MSCSHSDPTCTPEWLCEHCAYEVLVERNAVPSWFIKSGYIAPGQAKVAPEIKAAVALDTPPPPQQEFGGHREPSEAQLRLITILVKQKHYDLRVLPKNIDEASTLISELKKLPTPTPDDSPVGKWAKLNGDWCIKVPVGSKPGDKITVVKANGSSQVKVLGKPQKLAADGYDYFTSS